MPIFEFVCTECGAPFEELVRSVVLVLAGHAAEEFLKKAKVTRVRNIGTGVTLPEKATLVLDGVERFAAFKTIDERRQGITQLGGGLTHASRSLERRGRHRAGPFAGAILPSYRPPGNRDPAAVIRNARTPAGDCSATPLSAL